MGSGLAFSQAPVDRPEKRPSASLKQSQTLLGPLGLMAFSISGGWLSPMALLALALTGIYAFVPSGHAFVPLPMCTRVHSSSTPPSASRPPAAHSARPHFLACTTLPAAQAPQHLQRTYSRQIVASASQWALSNSVQQAADLFFIVKIPATLIAAAAIGQLLEAPEKTPEGSLMRTTYSFLVATTVFFQVAVVYITTACHVRLFAGGFDPFAASPVALCLRVVPLGFLAARIFFASGIATFLLSLALRTLLVYPAAVAQPIAAGSVTTIFGLLTYFNWERRQDAVYAGAGAMIVRLVQLGFQAMKGSLTGWLTMAGLLATLAYSAKALLACTTSTADTRASTQLNSTQVELS